MKTAESKRMKASALFVVVVVILSCFLHDIAAYSDCMVTCPTGCQEQKNCNSVACVCTCDCSSRQNPPPSTTRPPPTQPPPSTTRPPPTSNPTQPPPMNNPAQPGQALANQYCSNAGFTALGCIPEYVPALLDPSLQFDSYCCQNLKDLQTYCVYGFVPPEVAGINFFQFDYKYRCARN